MLAWLDDPATRVLSATKSGVVALPQFGVAVVLNENFAGDIPVPTVALPPQTMLQSLVTLDLKGLLTFHLATALASAARSST